MDESSDKKLWASSWIVLATALFAFYKKKYILGLVPLTCFIASLNYWKDSSNLKSRRVDIAFLILGLFIQIGYAQYIKDALNYYITLALAGFFWVISNLIYTPVTLPLSVFFHQLFHIFGSVSNIILYNSK